MRSWLREARAVFESVYGPASDISILIKDNAGRVLRLSVPPPDSQRPATEYQRTILDALGTKTVPPKQLARAAGYEYNSHFRGQLAEMVRTGTVRRTPDGLTVGR